MEVDGQPVDEITEYQDLRSIGSSEATWKLLSYPIVNKFPHVLALRVHLEDQQQIIFDEDTETEALETQRETELTAFFKFNSQSNLDAVSLPKYVDFPKSHVYDKSKKVWKIRKRGKDGTIGRVHAVNPVAGDVYYLRILLHDNHCKGKTSFDDMLSPMEENVKLSRRFAVSWDFSVMIENGTGF